jgi:G3E family GTPase
MKRIPVNLITGFLGVGKTTLVIELLRRKPVNERWAVLVNEYGEVGIDGAMIDGERGDGVTVREIAGGCVCCTTAPYLPVALSMLLQDGPLDRLIVETSGLGHPARLIDLFRGEHYKDPFELRATIGLVAPADFRCPGMFDNPVFMDQVHMADVLVLTKTDRVKEETENATLLRDFQTWGQSLFPPMLLIAAASQGVIDLKWLDLTAMHERAAKIAHTHTTHIRQPISKNHHN